MKVSVLIPTYNSERYIEAALDSVFRQTVAPWEVLVHDDGSTDSTRQLLTKYGSKVNAYFRKNVGVADARNFLTENARGDVLAYLDHDDIWHPCYIERQLSNVSQYPRAVAYFAAHRNFRNLEELSWESQSKSEETSVLRPSEFLKEYTHCPAKFGSMSFLCIKRSTINLLGAKPFPSKSAGADDYYLCLRLALLGDVCYSPETLVAYRISPTAQSANRLKSLRLATIAFKEAKKDYKLANPRLRRIFFLASASKRRQLAKVLLGAGNRSDAVRQILASFGETFDPVSTFKSVGMLAAAIASPIIRFKWPDLSRS